MTSEYLDAEQVGRFAQSQRALLLSRYGYRADEAQRAMDRWDARWAQSLTGTLPTLSDGDIDRLSGYARSDRKPVSKALFGERLKAAVERLLAPMKGKAESVSQWYHREVSRDAGQYSLDLLGVNGAWDWGDPSAPDKLVTAMGSKALQDYYGNHVDLLTKLIQEAIRGGRSDEEVRALVEERWPQLTDYQAERIARSEVAHMWQATSFVALTGNGIDEFDWVVAVAQDIEGSGVCTRCLKLSAGGPYKANVAPIPPRHPLCRCILVPALSKAWGTPEIPWTGGRS